MGSDEGPGKPGNTLAHTGARDTPGARALETQAGWDLAKIDEKEFDERLNLIKVRQQRMERIIKTVLVEGRHFGNPQVRRKGVLQFTRDANGNQVPELAFDKPILKQAGASELRNFFRYDCRPYAEPVITISAGTGPKAEWSVMVTVIVGLYDAYHNLLGTAVGACHSKERRFSYVQDARDQVNNIYKQAFKRAAVQVTAQCTGADAIFGVDDEVAGLVSTGNKEAAGLPMDEEQRQAFREACVARGLKTRGDVKKVIEEAFGPGAIVGSANFEEALDVIARYVKGTPATRRKDTVTPIRTYADPYAEGRAGAEPVIPEAGDEPPSGSIEVEDDDDDLPL